MGSDRCHAWISARGATHLTAGALMAV
jgi:hypothetical protein